MTAEALDQFRIELLNAFPPQIRPSDDRLVKREWDSELDESEERDIWEFLSGKLWTDLDRDALNNQSCLQSLALLLPEAYRYFLPAFLLTALNPVEPAATVNWLAFYSLLPPELPELVNFSRERLDQFTVAQRACVRKFLTLLKRAVDIRRFPYIQDVEKIERYLDSIWHAS